MDTQVDVPACGLQNSRLQRQHAGLSVDVALNGGLDHEARLNDIKSLRLRFTGQRGVCIPQSILDELWEHTPDRATPIHTTKMQWFVGR